MPREQGTSNFAANLEVLKAAPLDARLNVVQKDELKSLPFLYAGIIVYVEVDNQHYKWNGNDQTNLDNWEIVGGLYVNESIVPQTRGGFKQGEKATGPNGLTLQESWDKFLFPAIPPEINTFSASPRPEYNQPAPYDITINWSIQIRSANAQIETLTLEYKINGGWVDLNISSTSPNDTFTHTINTLNNSTIRYRLTVTDNKGGSNSSQITRSVQNYQRPSIGLQVNGKNGDTLERGSSINVIGNIQRRRQYVPLQSWSLKAQENNGSFVEVASNTNDISSQNTIDNITYNYSNGGSYNRLRFRLDVTDIEGNSSSSTRTVNFKDYSFFGRSTRNNYNSNLFSELSETITNKNNREYSFTFNSDFASAEHFWYLYPASYGSLNDFLLGPESLGLGSVKEFSYTPRVYNNPNGVNVDYYAIRSVTAGSYKNGQQIIFK